MSSLIKRGVFYPKLSAVNGGVINNHESLPPSGGFTAWHLYSRLRYLRLKTICTADSEGTN